MIHLHSMFSSEANTPTVGQNNPSALNQSALESFHGALSDAVSSTLEKFGIHPHDVSISITRSSVAPVLPEAPGSNTPARTAPPTPGTEASNSPAATGSSTASEAPNGGYDPFLQAAYSNPFPSAPTGNAAQSATPASTALDAQQAFDNAYWAQQPAAVQPLRTMQNQEQRAALATQLAGEGYSIDVPIMVWGWDPATVTSMRQADGYTWVPSAMQSPVELAPGLPSMANSLPYNPNNPPAGSIAV